MAIKIVEYLAASPNPTTLPRRMILTQELDSTLGGGERVTFEYTLEAGHNVKFEKADGSRVKSITRDGFVRGAAPITHYAKLVEGRGARLVTVEIQQTIRSEFGTVRSDAVVVALLR